MGPLKLRHLRAEISRLETDQPQYSEMYVEEIKTRECLHCGGIKYQIKLTDQERTAWVEL